MADLLCVHDCVPISFIGCGMTRRALLALEPGSRIWLEVEGKDLLFERTLDASDGSISRVLRPTASYETAWQQIYRASRGSVIELSLTERPVDTGRSAERWSKDDLPKAA